MSLPISTLLGMSAGPNDPCHSLSQQVPANNKHVLRNPVVIPIFWGRYFATTPTAVAQIISLLQALCGQHLNSLAQYGVASASLANPIVVDIPPPTSEPTTLSRDALQAQLTTWLGAGTVTPAPAANDTDHLYFILPPITADLTLPGVSTLGGYHFHGKYKAGASDDNLFWATVKTNGSTISSGSAFAQSLAYIISHELVESCSNRDGQGYTTGTCEIGDICETRGAAPCCSTYQYKGWQVEYYWSNWDMNCVEGSKPVSVRRFLSAIGVNGASGLRQLNTSQISIDFVASRSR
jgi:hypothetical protein